MLVSREEVTKLYVATFNRAPDSAGLDYWVNESGLSIEEIAQSFFDQEETQQKYPDTLTTEDFITAVYENLFDREPDAAGFSYWAEELNSSRVQKWTFIEAVKNGALGNDATILNNKTEVGLYFSEAGFMDTNKAKEIMTNISDNTSTVVEAKTQIDNSFRPTLNELTQKHSSNIEVIFDDSLPQEEQAYILDLHEKVTAVLTEITGYNPTQTFTMTYNPELHRSWNQDKTVLLADKLPSEDEWFNSWYTVDVSHQYFKEQGMGDIKSVGEYSNLLRQTEYTAQAVTSVVANEYGEPLGFNQIEIDFYGIHDDPEFFEAFQNLLDEANVFSINQTNTNYNMNSTAIAAATHDILSLYKLDRDFFKNMWSTPPSWENYIEYKEAMASAVHTLSYEDAIEKVNKMQYFKQIEEVDSRPQMNIDIALFSSLDFPNTTVNKQFALDTPTSFIIYGQSYNIDDNPQGTEVWDIVPDSDLYDSVASVTIMDNATGEIIYDKRDVDIKTDFANGYSDTLVGILNNGGSYTMNASTVVDGVLLTDSLNFSYIA